MAQITIIREKKFAGALMPYWVITGMTKAALQTQYGLQGDFCEAYRGMPVSRLTPEILDSIGVRIANGETKTIECGKSIFISTMDGTFSNEILTEWETENGVYPKLLIQTKGGFIRQSYPVLSVIPQETSS
jgi:hypothetical protein